MRRSTALGVTLGAPLIVFMIALMLITLAGCEPYVGVSARVPFDDGRSEETYDLLNGPRDAIGSGRTEGDNYAGLSGDQQVAAAAERNRHREQLQRESLYAKLAEAAIIAGQPVPTPWWEAME